MSSDIPRKRNFSLHVVQVKIVFLEKEKIQYNLKLKMMKLYFIIFRRLKHKTTHNVHSTVQLKQIG